MKHSSYNMETLNYAKVAGTTTVTLKQVASNAPPAYNVKYNGKELQEELGLNITGMDYRQYDNSTGRFNCVDGSPSQLC